MIQRNLKIGRWWVEFYFCPDGYDTDYLLDRMWTCGAPLSRLEQAYDLMTNAGPDTGFTFSNPYDLFAMVVIGPTSSGEEFLDTVVHEVHHLAVAVATELGINLDAETPAYLAGDSVRALAKVICQFGCPRCGSRQDKEEPA